MNRKLLVTILLVSVVINLVAVFTFGFFWREQFRSRSRPPSQPTPAAVDRTAQLDTLQARFKLSAVQMDTIRVLNEEMRTTMRPVQDTLSAKQDELLALLQGSAFDQARADGLMQEIVSLRATTETRSLGILLRMRNILTPEQRKELGELFMAFRTPGPQAGSKLGGNLTGRPEPGAVRPGEPPPAGAQPEGRPARRPRPGTPGH